MCLQADVGEERPRRVQEGEDTEDKWIVRGKKRGRTPDGIPAYFNPVFFPSHAWQACREERESRLFPGISRVESSSCEKFAAKRMKSKFARTALSRQDGVISKTSSTLNANPQRASTSKSRGWNWKTELFSPFLTTIKAGHYAKCQRMMVRRLNAARLFSQS